MIFYEKHCNKKVVISIFLILSVFIGQFSFCQNQLILTNTVDSSRLKIIPINAEIHLDLKLITLDSGSTMKNIRMYAKLYGIGNNVIMVKSFNENFNIKHETARHFSVFKTYRGGTGMRTLKWDQISKIYYEENTKRAVWGSVINELGFSTWICALIIPPLVSINYESGGFNTKRYLSLAGGGFLAGVAFIKIGLLIEKKGSTIFRINQHPDPNKLNKHEWKIVSQ
ncbi:MAG: hypothetical protein HY840_14595 [Bacteroidetes bacterium]|nr:hypothetical protein [Bacteroidota bacterium]